VARAAAEAKGFDQVVLIPSAQPPHKPGSADLAAAEDRLAMCRLAVESSPGSSDLFQVNDLELRRHGPSYTIDTARSLTQRGWGKIHWLIGGDTLPLLPTWHEPDALLAEVEFVIVARPGSEIDWDRVAPAYRHLRQNCVVVPRIDISATEVRRRRAAGKPIDFLTPEPVVRYILDKGLYR
jgi:nicotinate-nucleotide adenylyltransferase